MGKAAFCNMDGCWGHYTKLNKSDRERQLLCDGNELISGIKKKKELIERTDWRLLAVGFGGGQNGRWGSKGTKLPAVK